MLCTCLKAHWNKTWITMAFICTLTSCYQHHTFPSILVKKKDISLSCIHNSKFMLNLLPFITFIAYKDQLRVLSLLYWLRILVQFAQLVNDSPLPSCLNTACSQFKVINAAACNSTASVKSLITATPTLEKFSERGCTATQMLRQGKRRTNLHTLHKRTMLF